ncbi:dihydrolipoyl dehydrogenase [Mycoplasma mycoides]|uniref:dihydrolipoyl dehydrogenase n=1 Tax=Mycoplasma mycoides TaxID=2102 RepID=UPI002240A2C1|nr:dihydrolipoyl dehydrogenase [Mycoplasma mycoides]QVK05420.1 dihydrolipoyl dehydrogenase [Mycoplasma mycoides subsp. capri]QVK06206.1 dihydrolipoyl dehydrogenase [Mycoplasma mycoides subsp. capri]QVK09122.1 dihydrolipoyl dehydrogenase [Mycoplasma mycoides subsp. capri]
MFKVKFADIGEGLTEGTVAEVLVKVGDVVKEGQPLYFVETDKVNSEIPSPVAGKIAVINISTGQEIKVGDVVIEIDDGTSSSTTEPKVEVVEENASVVGATPVSNDVLPSRAPKPKADTKKTEQVEENASVVGATPVSNDVLPSRAPKPKTEAPKVDVQIEDTFDVCVVGAGIGGYVTAIKSAQLGLKTLIIEKEYYGGVCLNVGCIPTKTLLKTSHVYHDIMHKAKELGIVLQNTEKVVIDWAQALQRKNGVVKKLTGGVKYLLDKNKVTQIKGEAVALDKNTISVNNKNYRVNNLIIASGSTPNHLPLPGFDQGRKDGIIIDSTGILSIPKIPETLVVIGGGVIGIEFSCLFASLGTKVTVLQGLPTILEMLDKDIIDAMTKELKNRYNIEVITNASVKEFKNGAVVYQIDGKDQMVKGEYVLESVGRKTSLTGFENIGLELTPRKGIVVNEYQETNLDGVYAIGDVVGKVMLAHTAVKGAIVAANRIAKKANKDHAEDIVMDYDRIPSCIYTHPEVSMIGKTEQQLKQENIEYKTFKFPFSAIGKALADDDTSGFVKIIIEPKYKTILGAHIIGNRATEMISEIAAVIECEGTITEIANTIHPHPTMSEAIGEAAEALETGKAIHF